MNTKLRPIRDKDKYTKVLQDLLAYELYHLIYKPMIDLLSNDERLNDKRSALVNAFMSGRLTYKDGFVYGKFNAELSSALRELNARFNKTKKAYKIDLARLPLDVRNAISVSVAKEKESIDKMLAKAKELEVQKVLIPAIGSVSRETIADLHKQFRDVTPATVGIKLDMTEEQEKFMLQEYTKNLDLEINGLAQKAVEKIRVRVEKEVGMGTRSDRLKEILMADFGITRNRAKFIARQETSLFVAKYRRARYEESGSNMYEWSTSNDQRVRDDHKHLNGKIFSWDNPPITNKVSGARNNPGEDFGCRCVALPVIMVDGRNILK